MTRNRRLSARKHKRGDRLYQSNMSLPEYHMTAGESKNITIPIYNTGNKQIDASGMTARLAVSEFGNIAADPLFTKNCSVVAQEGELMAVLFVDLVPEDTVNLYGKYIYQITAKDFQGAFGVLRGVLHISPNNDKTGISL